MATRPSRWPRAHLPGCIGDGVPEPRWYYWSPKGCKPASPGRASANGGACPAAGVELPRRSLPEDCWQSTCLQAPRARRQAWSEEYTRAAPSINTASKREHPAAVGAVGMRRSLQPAGRGEPRRLKLIRRRLSTMAGFFGKRAGRCCAALTGRQASSPADPPDRALPHALGPPSPLEAQLGRGRGAPSCALVSHQSWRSGHFLRMRPMEQAPFASVCSQVCIHLNAAGPGTSSAPCGAQQR